MKMILDIEVNEKILQKKVDYIINFIDNEIPYKLELLELFKQIYKLGFREGQISEIKECLK